MIFRRIVQPEQNGRAIDRREQPALGVEIIVGRGIARRFPDGIHRLVEAACADPAMPRNRQIGERPAHRLFMWHRLLKPDTHGCADALADLHSGRIPALEGLHHVPVGPVEKMADTVRHTSGEQPIKLGNRDTGILRAMAQGLAAPAVEHDMRQDAVEHPVPLRLALLQYGIGVFTH